MSFWVGSSTIDITHQASVRQHVGERVKEVINTIASARSGSLGCCRLQAMAWSMNCMVGNYGTSASHVFGKTSL